MFSDRNGAKTIPFGVACAYSWISLYTPPQAKKPLVIARLLTPSPPKRNNNNSKSTVGHNYLLLRYMSL